MSQPSIHPTAEISSHATIGQDTRIWHHVQIREDAVVGRNCIIGKGVYIDFGVVIGNNVKVQNGCCIYHGATLLDGVFLGPGVILTNDKYPRAVDANGLLKTDGDWTAGKILVKHGASLGARSVVLPDIGIGEFAMVGAGAIVTEDVPDHGLVMGNPAKLCGFVCRCGRPLKEGELRGRELEGWCEHCERSAMIAADQWWHAEDSSHRHD